MATMDELYAALKKADAAGDVQGARTLAAYIKAQPAAQTTREKIDADPISQGAKNFAKDMGGVDQFVSAYGGALPSIANGIRQFQGLLNPQAALYNKATDLQGQIDETKRLDAPLHATGAGMAGSIAGNVAPMLATGGAGSGMLGATAVGAGIGAIQPVASDESRLANTAIGGVAGPAGVLAGRTVGALYQGGRALVEPFTEAGRSRIAGRMINRFADNPLSINGTTSAPTITGARPTLAEQTGDAGLARLQDSLRAADPLLNNQIGGRLAENNAARVNALQGLAGDSKQMASAVGARAGATKPLYDEAVSKSVDVSPELRALLDRPSVQQALGRASNIAKEEGRSFDLGGAIQGHAHGHSTEAAPVLLGKSQWRAAVQPAPEKTSTVSGQTLQDLKMGLDALLKDPTSGIAGKEAANIRETRDALIRWMESAIPEFKAARTGYAAASKPINGMQVGEEIARRATSNTSDLAGNPRMQANALLGMLRDEPALIERALGKGRGNALSDVFDPTQLNLLRNVAGETDRAAAVASAGNGPGSATAQRMASQNVLRQIIGPTGLPQSWAENALANTVVGKPLNLIYGGIAEPKIQQALARAVLDPDAARAVLQAAKAQSIQLPPSTLKLLLAQAGRSAAPVAAVPGQR